MGDTSLRGAKKKKRVMILSSSEEEDDDLIFERVTIKRKTATSLSDSKRKENKSNSNLSGAGGTVPVIDLSEESNLSTQSFDSGFSLISKSSHNAERRDNYQKMKEENEAMKEENEALKAENDRLTEEVSALRAENESLKKVPKKVRMMKVTDKRNMEKQRKHQVTGPKFDPKNKEYVKMIKKMRKNSKGGWDCPLTSCSKSYTHKGHCISHVEDTHFGRQHFCKQCDKISASKAALRGHVRRHHSEFKYIGPLPNLKTVLVLEDGKIVARPFEEEDRNNLCEHWLCEFKKNPDAGEPSPHLFQIVIHAKCSNYTGILLTSTKCVLPKG